MKITPIEIRQKTFERTFRGYDKEEVTAFLESLSQEWERVQTELREHKMKLEIAEKEVGQLREVESSLFKTLKTAEDTGSTMVEQAKKMAELRMKEAQVKADAILSDARTQARTIIQKAEVKARGTMQSMLSELKDLEREYKTLESYKENLTLEIRNLVNAMLERLERSESKKSAVHIFHDKMKETQELMEEQEEKIIVKEKEKVEARVTLKKAEPEDDGPSESFFDQI